MNISAMICLIYIMNITLAFRKGTSINLDSPKNKILLVQLILSEMVSP